MRCSWCEREVPEEDLRVTDRGRRICLQCIDREGGYFRPCVVCGVWWVEGGSICRNCRDEYSTCCECGCVVEVDTLSFERLSRCNSCASDFATCGECGGFVRINDMVDGMCERCYGYQIIHPYNYRPSLTFNGKGPLYFGVEVEVECNPSRNRMEEARNLLSEFPPGGLYWLMHDGSLDYGYEIGTHPCTLKYHQTKFPWSKMLKYLRQVHCTGSTCGLHVHISKVALTATEQMKLQYFVHNQTNLMWCLARRNGGEYTKFLDKKLSRRDLPLDTRDRHEAVNLSNRDTVEIRIFKGTLDRLVVLASIELCHALVSYVRTINFNDLKLSNKARVDFLEMIMRTPKTYWFLPEYLRHLQIV